MAINPQPLEDLLSSFSSAFYSDDFSLLFSIYDSIHSYPQSSDHVESLLASNLELQKFKEDSSFYDQSLSYLFSPEWDLVSEINDIKVESHYSGANFYTRASVLINAGIIETISVIAEVDLLPSWIHALSRVTVLDEPARFKKLARYEFWFPWPLANRECLLEFSAYPVAEKQGMLLVMRSPSDKYLRTQLPVPNDDAVRMFVNFGCIFVQFVNPGVTKVSILVQANATIFPVNLPEWLLNFGKKQIMYFVMDAMRETVQGFYGSEYESRIKRNEAFYGFLKRVLKNELDIC